MKTTFLLTAISVLALASVPAFAAGDKVSGATISAKGQVQRHNTVNGQAFPELKQSDVDRSRNATENALDRAGRDLGDAADTAADNIHDAVNGDSRRARVHADLVTAVAADKERTTAENMIGKPVYNDTGKKVASVKDILLDDSGNARQVVLADGGFLGMGEKLVVVDYSAITHRDSNGDVIIPITEAAIDGAPKFSYDASNGVSVKKALDGSVLNASNGSVASVDDIAFRNGEASQLIVSYGAGKKAALDFDSLKLVRSKTDVDFKLSANQAAQFETYKKTASN